MQTHIGGKKNGKRSSSLIWCSMLKRGPQSTKPKPKYALKRDKSFEKTTQPFDILSERERKRTRDWKPNAFIHMYCICCGTQQTFSQNHIVDAVSNNELEQ